MYKSSSFADTETTLLSKNIDLTPKPKPTHN